MENFSLFLFGVLLSVLGIVNIMGNISTIHSYNRMGASLIAAFIATFWSERLIGYIVIPALILGLGFILYAQFKYNKGIF